MSQSSRTDSSTSPLSSGERATAVVVAVVFLALGVLTIFCPPNLTEFAPQCAAKDCTAQVASVPTGATVLLLALGSLMIFMAVNGLKLVSFSFGGVSGDASTKRRAQKDVAAVDDIERFRRTDASEATEGTTVPVSEGVDFSLLDPARLPGSLISAANGGRFVTRIDGHRFDVVDPDLIPARVLGDLSKASQLPGPLVPANIEYGIRPAGDGNQPWSVKLRDSDSFLKLSYNEEGTEATVVEIPGPDPTASDR